MQGLSVYLLIWGCFWTLYKRQVHWVGAVTPVFYCGGAISVTCSDICVNGSFDWSRTLCNLECRRGEEALMENRRMDGSFLFETRQLCKPCKDRSAPHSLLHIWVVRRKNRQANKQKKTAVPVENLTNRKWMFSGAQAAEAHMGH